MLAAAELLQCGRIYKDAEIPAATLDNNCYQYLQCGRIYKDAETSMPQKRGPQVSLSFNVAASIKMRK